MQLSDMMPYSDCGVCVCVCGVNKVNKNKKTSHPDHVFKSTVVCNRFSFCIELCYSSAHADLRTSITVKFLKKCICSYETKNLLTN